MISQTSPLPPYKVIVAFDDGRWLLVLWLDQFILKNCHACNAFILKSLKSRVESFLNHKQYKEDADW